MIPRRRTERRGAALQTVFLFMIVASALIAFVIVNARDVLVAEGETSRSRRVTFVLHAGISEAILETRLLQDLDADDPAGFADGYGARGTGWPDALGPGIVVRDADGHPLGSFITMVDRVAPRSQMLYALAGSPDLTNPNSRLIGARVELVGRRLGLFGDRCALAFAGGTSSVGQRKGKIGFQTGGTNKHLTINAGTPYNGRYVPAVNISDPGSYDTFMDQVAYENWGDISDDPTLPGVERPELSMLGGDLADEGRSLTTTPRQTIGQAPSSTQRLSENDMQEFVEVWTEPVGAIPDATWDRNADGVGSGGDLIDGGSLVGGGGVYRLSATTVRDTHIAGKGTLVVPQNTTFDGVTIDWEGEIILAPTGSGGSGSTFTGASTVNVAGAMILATEGGPSDGANLSITGGTTINVAGTPGSEGGAFLVMAGGDSSAAIAVGGEGGGEATVNVDGLFGLLGDKIGFEVTGKNATEAANFSVTGTTMIAVPVDAGGTSEFLIGHDGSAVFDFDNPSFEAGIETAEGGPGGGPHQERPPVELVHAGYQELTGAEVKAVMETLWEQGDAEFGLGADPRPDLDADSF